MPPKPSPSTSTSDAELKDFAQFLMDPAFNQSDRKGHDSPLRPHITILSATLTPKPTLEISFAVKPQHANSGGNFHGGAIATLFDYVTSIALMLPQKEGMFRLGGVSRGLNCVYLRPAPVGSEVLLRAEVEAVGKRMALVRGTMARASDGAVIATCTHDKANTDPPLSKL
ncbi:hypothetical protein MMC10_002579 [Thelotrema lepadinum]|nr:hypothetical protein [Thelotrema lepadinum]